MRITQRNKRPLFAPLATAILVPFGLAIVSCVTSAQRLPYALDCDAGAPYTISVYESYELNDPSNLAPWYAAGDFTPGATLTTSPNGSTLPATRIEGNGRCGSQYALLLESHGHHDWGSTFGDYRIGTYSTPAPLDVSQYEGVSFWARDPGYTSRYDGPTTKSIALNLIDVHGTAGIATGFMVTYDGGACTNYVFDGGGAMNIPVSTATGLTPTGSMPVSGIVYPADACDNALFTLPIVLSDEWQLYTIPFTAFKESALPNREPNGLDVTALMSFTISVPKEEQLELWIDDFGFYRTNAKDGGTAERSP
ncbi:MAG TPA: hypothetical protein VGM06_21035 [Polyangiaceae bacterium]|jgi:hypothetical protein